MTLRRVWITSLLLTLTASAAQAKTKYQPPSPLSPEQSALVQKAIAAEKVTIKQIQKHSPLVQTYIQNMRPDQVLYAVPESDQYLLGRVDFGKSITDTSYSSEGNEPRSVQGLDEVCIRPDQGVQDAVHLRRLYGDDVPGPDFVRPAAL